MWLSIIFPGLLFSVIYSSPVIQIDVEEVDVPLDDPEINQGYFEGDIDLGHETRNAINIAVYRSALWPNGIVPYQFHSSYPASIKSIFTQAMLEIEEDTKVHGQTCVKFVPKTSSHHDYIYIVPQTGCHSPVGHHSGRGVVSLGHGCERKGTVMHEMLHVLGFWHEQNRYDRDNYVNVILSNVDSAHIKDFTKHTTHDMTTFGEPYDYGSIMHYGAYNFAIDKSKPTLTPKHSTSVVIGQREKLSRYDVDKVQKLYKCGSDLSHIVTPATPHHLIDCDFEHGICNLHQESNDGFDWATHSGTTTHGTGPTADHTNGAGHYLLALSKHHHNKITRISSASTLTAGHNCIDFNLFMHGSGVNSLKLLASGSGFNQAFKSYQGSQQNQWIHTKINLNVPRQWKLTFEAHIGGSNLGDIAIDDLIVYAGNCV